MNLILGENGAGKTSFLEGAHLIYTGMALRDPYDRMILEGADRGGVRAHLEEGYRDVEKTVILRPDGVERYANAKKISKLREFQTHNTIVFEPYDTMLIDGSGGMRRRFIDRVISVVSPLYERTLTEYANLLRIRNQMLRKGAPSVERAYMELLERDMIEKNALLRAERQRYLGLIEKRTLRHLEDIEGTWKVGFAPLPSRDEGRDARAMESLLSEDRRRGYTTWGSHLDDMAISFGGREAKTTASRGQKRAIVISMKLAAADIFDHLTHRETILLLDDLLYELDEKRRKTLTEKIRKYTALVTSTAEVEADHVIRIRNRMLIT